MADDTWLDELIRADTGAAPAPTLTHADLKGYPQPVLSTEQHLRFTVLTAKINGLQRKLRSRKKADVAAREQTQAQIDAAIVERNAVFGSDRPSP